ncbi:protein kinase domain-containing protein [Archangium sp.]|uniref:protein kinase domain-containing protein n=1 Tax=Archangium sp. TaxID=1872627 RepID=UPI002D252DAB|nr:protein kinase [Archangium sp.]HYO57051.1 protein kinase [Archangium sp.]
MPGNTGRNGGRGSDSGFTDSDFGDELLQAVTQGSDLLRVPTPGERLGGQDGHRFEILEPLGGGSMGRVFRAWDAQLRRVVALKFLLPGTPLGEERLASLLQQEARAIAQFAHANIVRLFDASEWAGAPWEPRIPFLIMECLEGESLAALLQREPRLEPRRALDVLGGIAAGLAHAHEHHVIHRDLKPSNVFLTPRGEVKLLDFGLAWLLEERNPPGFVDLPNAGTPAYMAPEQWRGERQDERTDIWAAGILLYEMLTGAPPYPSASLQELRARVLAPEPVPPVRERQPELPREVEPVLATLLAKAPERRYQTAQELVEELRELREALGFQEQARRHAAPERRQVTLVSCRLTGLAAPGEALDAEDVSELEEAFHQLCAELVQQWGGSIVLSMGDEVLACFGYPVVREDDSEHAVQVGLALAREVPATLQRKLPRLASRVLAVKVGIHTDQVTLSEPTREQGSHALVLQGEAPKVVTWLAGQAGPHTVVASEATWTLVRGTFETEALGSRVYEGLAGTSRLGLHRVLRERPATFRFERTIVTGGLTPLVGRERELQRLLAHWDEARRGQGAIVLVTGEAGVGKSRLIQELHERVCQESCIHFQCQCWSQSSTSAFQPIIEVLRRLFASHAVRPEVLGLPAEHVPLLTQLLSLPEPKGQPTLQLSPERRKERTLEALAALLSHVARTHPVLGVVEDLNWADPSTLELLGYLLERMEKQRVLFVLSARPDFHPTWPPRPWLHRLALERLSPEHTATLVREAAGGRMLPPEVVQQLVARTDGIPLFVEEMTRMVLERGTPDAIPITLHELLLARLDMLPSRQKSLAQCCAVLGRSFSHALLATLTRRSPPTLQRDLEGLVAAGLLQPLNERAGPGYRFRHALIQDAAGHSLPRSARRKLHQRITHALLEQCPEVGETQPELLAHHYTGADEYEPAIRYWFRAGQRASLRSANKEAVSHFQHALRLLRLQPDTPTRLQEELRLLISLGIPLAQMQGYRSPEVERTYTRARELIHQVGGALPRLQLSYWGLFVYYFSRAEYALAHELAGQLVAQGERHQDMELLALGHRMMAADFYIWGDLGAALEHIERGLACPDLPLEEHRAIAEKQWINPRAATLAFGAMVYSALGREKEARRSSQEALELARRIGHPHTTATVLNYICVACQLRREARCALEWSAEAITLAREHGFRASAIWATLIHGWAMAGLGQARAGLALIREAIEAWRGPGISAGLFHHDLGLLAELHLKLEQPHEALALLTEALERAPVEGQHFYEAELHRLRGMTLRALGREPEARECFLRAIQVARQQGARAFEQRALEELGTRPPEQHPA